MTRTSQARYALNLRSATAVQASITALETEGNPSPASLKDSMDKQDVDEEVFAQERGRINQLDTQLIEILQARVAVSHKIQNYRIECGARRSDIPRENEIIRIYGDALGVKRGTALAMEILKLCKI
ncbi:chorismate mutase family protein [Streptomyces zaomyceticus]|uniref:chorismate mutase n=1 Tax=Streptomyces zaomyceticus TaxID=68286 RepID=UPI003694AFF0